MDHFAGVTVDHFTEPIPGQSPLSRRVSLYVTQTRPRDLLGDATETIPDHGLSVFGGLIAGSARTIREQQKEASANKKTSGAHVGLVSSSQHPLMHSGNIQLSS